MTDWKTAIATLGTVRDYLKKAQQIELLAQLVDAEGAMLELQRENYRLTRELDELNDRRAAVAGLTYHHQSYWRGEEGPFCSACVDSRQQLTRLRQLAQTSFPEAYTCPVCGAEFQIFVQP